MYHYFKCKRNGAHRMAVNPVAGVVATPICSNCGGPTVKIGEGVAPVAPPDPPAAPLAVPNLPDDDAVIYQGNGDHGWRGNVGFRVMKNNAQAHVIIEVALPQRPLPYVVRCHATLLNGNNANAPVSPPTGGGYRHTINTRSDQMANLAQPLMNPIAMTAQMNFTLNLGHAGFGLIHVIAGHHDDLRTLTGAGVAMVGGGSPEMEQYRSFAAIQVGLQHCLSMASLQAIYQDTADASKWIFVGRWNARAVIVVTRRAGNVYSITTLYIGDQAGAPAAVGGGHRSIAWKRRQAVLPPGW